MINILYKFDNKVRHRLAGGWTSKWGMNFLVPYKSGVELINNI